MDAFLLIVVSICYVLLFILYPFVCLGHFFKGRRFFDIVIISLVLGNFIVITIVYALYLLNIYNTFSLIIGLILNYVLCQALGGKKRLTMIFEEIKRLYELIITKQFRFRVFMGRVLDKFKNYHISRPKCGYVIGILLLVLTTVAIGYGLYTRLYSAVATSYFGTSDMYVHLDWIREMQTGELFSNGIYPFGFHCTTIALHTLFPFDIVLIMRFMGSISYMLMLLSILHFAYRAFKSPFARLAVIWFFCVSDIFITFYYYDYRFGYAIPQEWAMTFILPAITFLLCFFKERDMKSLIIAAGCFGLTVYIHFYSAILLALGILAVFLLNIPAMFKKGVFKRLFITFFTVAVFTVLPLLIAFIQGKPLEQSLGWAMNVAQSQIEEDTPAKEPTQAEITPETPIIGFIDQVFNTIQSEIHLTFFEDENYRYSVSKYPTVLLVCFVISIVYVLLIKIRKKEQEVSYQQFLLLYCLMLFLLLVSYSFGMLKIMEAVRLRSFLRIIAILTFGIIPEALYSHTIRSKPLFRGINVVLAGIVLFLCVDVFYLKNIAVINLNIQAQYTSTVRTLMRIKKELPNDSYTIVATTQELPQVRNEGFHYELVRFIRDMENYHSDMEQFIPTKNVYLFIEKNVLSPFRYVFPSDGFMSGQSVPISETLGYSPLPEDQKLELRFLSDFYYKNQANRSILMSKAFLWAKEMEKFYPNEITVYYEDDDIVVYELVQDPYALNNLSIPYGANQ